MTMDYLFHALELAGLGWLIWRGRTRRVRASDPGPAEIARAIVRHEMGRGGGGRERLRACLEAKAAKREAMK